DQELRHDLYGARITVSGFLYRTIEKLAAKVDQGNITDLVEDPTRVIIRRQDREMSGDHVSAGPLSVKGALKLQNLPIIYTKCWYPQRRKSHVHLAQTKTASCNDVPVVFRAGDGYIRPCVHVDNLQRVPLSPGGYTVHREGPLMPAPLCKRSLGIEA